MCNSRVQEMFCDFVQYFLRLLYIHIYHTLIVTRSYNCSDNYSCVQKSLHAKEDSLMWSKKLSRIFMSTLSVRRRNGKLQY